MASKESSYPPLSYYLPEPRRSGSPIVTVCIVLMAIVALGMGGTFIWKTMGGKLPALPTMATQRPILGVGGGDTGTGVGAPATQPNLAATSQAEYDATVAKMKQSTTNQQTGATIPNNTLPTAEVRIKQPPPVEQITVVPKGFPETYAAGSDVRPTIAPTLPIPTALPDPMIGAGVSADGKCVQAQRDGKTYQVCQGWKFTPAEAASVADYLRTGLVPGEEVR